MFLLGARFVGKALLLVFLLVLASQLESRAFLDFEVITSLINFLIWIFLAVTFSVARIGVAFPPEDLDVRLKGLLQYTQIPALIAGMLISLFVISIGFLFDQARTTRTLEIQLIVASFALVQFLYSYLLGFHQARENYRLVGVFYLAPGHDSESQVWYAGTSPQGLFRSEDGGDNWEEIYQISPSNQNIWEPIYVDLSGYANESNVLIAFHSNDQGETGTGWAVDDVTLLTAYQESEGFIVGSVYSEETGESLSDVYIEAVSEDSSVYSLSLIHI